MFANVWRASRASRRLAPSLSDHQNQTGDIESGTGRHVSASSASSSGGADGAESFVDSRPRLAWFSRFNSGSSKQNKGGRRDSQMKIESAVPIPSEAPYIPPVDGKEAWLVVAGSFIAQFVVLGYTYSVGVFVQDLATYYNKPRGEVSLVGTLALGFFYIGGIFSGALGDKYGTRRIAGIGTIVWCIALLLASIATQMWETILAQGVLTGLGTALVYWPAMSVVPQWFNKYRATAVGLAVLGSGIGNLVIALVSDFLIDTFGWRVALRVLALSGGMLLLVSVRLMHRRLPPRSMDGLFDASLELIHDRNYRLFNATTFCFQFGFFVPFVHLAGFTHDLGLSDDLQAATVAMLGVGSAVGRLTLGPAADLLGRLTISRLCMFGACFWMAIWPFCTKAESVMAFAFFYAYFSAGFFAMTPVLAADIWGASRLGSVFAFVNIARVPGGMSSGPIAGHVRDVTGSYSSAIWFSSTMIFIAFLCLMRMRLGPSKRVENAPVNPANNMDQEPPVLKRQNSIDSSYERSSSSGGGGRMMMRRQSSMATSTRTDNANAEEGVTVSLLEGDDNDKMPSRESVFEIGSGRALGNGEDDEDGLDDDQGDLPHHHHLDEPSVRYFDDEKGQEMAEAPPPLVRYTSLSLRDDDALPAELYRVSMEEDSNGMTMEQSSVLNQSSHVSDGHRLGMPEDNHVIIAQTPLLQSIPEHGLMPLDVVAEASESHPHHAPPLTPGPMPDHITLNIPALTRESSRVSDGDAAESNPHMLGPRTSSMSLEPSPHHKKD